MTPFERDLHDSAAFRQLCQDDDFATKLYNALENQEWVKDHKWTFRMQWVAFWYGFFHPFNSEQGRREAARRIASKYMPDKAKPTPDKTFSCSWRYAGGLVADLRDKGECYMDFYCGGVSCTVAPEVEEALAELGWYPNREDKQNNNNVDSVDPS